MRFVCPEHDELESVKVNGYSLGHETGLDGPNERDLEGITFTFSTRDDGRVYIEDAGGAEEYLRKFANWREKLVEANDAPDPEMRSCPKCGRPAWLLEDDEPLPSE